jgi:hypothetical protein
VQTILKTPDEILDLERQFYLNIKSKERFFEQYFLVEFIGKGFPHAYKVCSSAVHIDMSSQSVGKAVCVSRHGTREIREFHYKTQTKVS